MNGARRVTTQRGQGFQILVSKGFSRCFALACVSICLNLILTAGTISRDLQSALTTGTTANVVVQFRRMPLASEIAELKAHGALVRQIYKNIPAASMNVPVRALKAISGQPQVLGISPDRTLFGQLDSAVPAIGADIAFSSGWTGEGVGIAVVDSGISSGHADIKGRVVRAENFVANETTTDDLYGHGTHVAIAAAGNGSASTGANTTVTFRGVAPRAHLINLRVLDATGQGSASSVIAAIDRAIELKNVYNIRVLNLSLGRSIFESYTLDPLCNAIERTWKAGIVVVVAAGNNGRSSLNGESGYGTISSPGNSPYAITVGAMRDMGTASRADDLMASYSSKGPTLIDHIAKPDLVAPGNRVVSGMNHAAVLRTAFPDNVVSLSYYRIGNASASSSLYFRLSGTSIAAPLVSGAAALILQQHPELRPDQVKARLMKTATTRFPATSTLTDSATGAAYSVTYDLFTVGAGYLDIQAALNNHDETGGSALSPRAAYDPQTGVVRLQFEGGSVWNSASPWSSAVIWGSNVVLNGMAVIWGTAVVWGSQTNEGFAVIWGSDTVLASSEPFPLLTSIHGE
jgi:serine protease AprX